ncbi:MAG: type 2 lantipeptide synthetase LanM [Planctomycetaceae bacterium]|nr:type 2 lantipeptide synthetase LanM [Planctomycetaceae bacterium]
MKSARFNSTRWYAATSLKERSANLNRSDTGQHYCNGDQEVSFHEQKWKEQAPFEQSAVLERRLAVDNLSSSEFSQLLAEPLVQLQERLGSEPEWLTRVRESFRTAEQSDSDWTEQEVVFDDVSGFLYAIKPLMKESFSRLVEGIEQLAESYEHLPFDPETVGELLWNYLPNRLTNMLFRSFILELNAKRLQGELAGETPQERFRLFVQQLQDPVFAESLLVDYPVLVRQVLEKLDQAVDTGLEFLEQLCRDYTELCEKFSPDENPGLLRDLSDDVGDSHQGGRFVRIAEFESGLRIVYKPRSLATDVHLQQFLLWLNEHGASPRFQTTNVLDLDDHGWVEFVEQRACQDRGAVSRFYERIGGYLAILYVLRATDFHHENIIAHGEHPVLIDLESLFNPLELPSNCGGNSTDATSLADGLLNDSVLRVGLLPARYWSNAESHGIDFSGLGGTAGQVAPDKVHLPVDAGTDNIKVVPTSVEMRVSKNLPSLKGESISVPEFREEIVSGFRNTYRLLQQQRDSLLSEDGPLAEFAEDTIRVILRSTRTYGHLLSGSHHPDLLRDGLDRDRFFDQLWIGHEGLRGMDFIFSAERDDLWREDIPYFKTRVDSHDMWSASGERSAGYFERSGYELVRDQLAALDEVDLERQTWFVEASLNVLAHSHTGQKGDHVAPTRAVESACSPEELIEASERIGQRLCATALRGDDDASWIGLELANDKEWALSTLSLDLYDGMPGVALYLGYLGHLTGKERYTEFARLAVSTIKKQCRELATDERSIGAFDGWSGVIYTLTHLGTLWQDPSLLELAVELIDRIPPLIQHDDASDIISGAAGAILSLLGVHRLAATSKALPTAVSCGDHLLEVLEARLPGSDGRSGRGSKPLLSGFSHGAAGMALALFELAEAGGDRRYSQMALRAVEYERQLFRSEVGNWLDLRDCAQVNDLRATDGEQNQFECTWCHGAAGIGLARLLTLPHLDEPAVRHEIDVALATTIHDGFHYNHSLCHGDLGNLETFLLAAEVLDDSSVKTQSATLAASILESIREHGPRCGIPLDVETPGFMTGMAGIGYGLLRSAAPDRIPSVLALQPPRETR